MKLRRCLFISALLVLFLCCFHVMNQSYDELSRYQYANEKNRSLILRYLDEESINYLIDRQYAPEEFIHYIDKKDFKIQLVDWYNIAKKTEQIDDMKMIKLVNALSEKMTFLEFEKNCENFTITQLYDFYFALDSQACIVIGEIL